MALTDAQKKANMKYRKENVKRIPLDVQKEKYEEIAAVAKSKGETVNGYIKKAVDERMKRDSLSISKPGTGQKPAPPDVDSIDLHLLATDIKYQIEVSSIFGDNVLRNLLEQTRKEKASEG